MNLGHHPCRVSDPHIFSFILIVDQNYSKSAEKANCAIYNGAADTSCEKTGP